MRLKCNKCHHDWDEDLSGSAAMVQCPECYAVVPLVLASGGQRSGPTAARKPAQEQMVISAAETNPIWSSSGPPAALKTPPEGTDLHELPTIVDNTPTVTQRPAAAADEKRPRKLSDQFHTPVQALKTLEAPPLDGDTPTYTNWQDEPPKTVTIHDEEEKKPSKPRSTSKSIDAASPKEIDLAGEVIGGYEVKTMLGAGGMGAVCLARQISLDRDVALKILPGRFATNPDFLVRFTREALSAAQLTHHNVIQVYDVGSDKDINFISMEYVRGESLGDMVRRDGPLQPDDAASYVLQAARGLNYAHQRGIVHRDVKPDNLLINEHGIVKVADLGLAKMRGDGTESKPAENKPLDARLAQARGDLTLQEVAMGTPAYMAPEQARDATNVDFRADQYSLGCTLYYLCAGKPPYSGTTAMEIITKHMEAPPPNLEEAARKVPGGLNVVLQRMLAKTPEERYDRMAEAIEDLEALLGVGAEKGPFTPREQHLQILEKAQGEYYGVGMAGVQKACVTVFFGGTLCILVAAALLGMPYAAGTALGLLLLTPAVNFVIGGILHKSYLFRRVRSVFFGMTPLGWIKTVVGTVAGLGVIYALGLLPYWIIAIMLSAGLVAAYQTMVLRKLQAQRAEPLEQTRNMLKQLRLRGLSEDALQDFTCRFSGARWEEMFEDLFGYEEMVLARGRWAAADHLTARKRFATWRDPIARWLHTLEEDRKAAREKRQLAKVETKRLKSQGVSEREAKEKAERLAAKAHADIKVATNIEESIPSPIRARRIEKHLPDLVLQLVRLVIGAAVTSVFAAWFLQSRFPALSQVNTQLAKLPLPHPIRMNIYSWYGASAGVLLFISAFSWRRIATALISVGAMLVLAGGYVLPLVMPHMEMLTSIRYYLAALGISAFGLLICVSAKLSGHRF